MLNEVDNKLKTTETKDYILKVNFNKNQLNHETKWPIIGFCVHLHYFQLVSYVNMPWISLTILLLFAVFKVKRFLRF